MGKYPPPSVCPGEPSRTLLRAGTPVYRVHATHRESTAYNSRPSHPFYFGGRFDSTPLEPYDYAYVGFSAAAAVCEVLLRSVPFDDDGSPRLLPRAVFEQRSLSFLRLSEDIEVVSLMSGKDLAAVAQDTWLVHTEGGDYPQTRDWGHWIRRQTSTWAAGFVWPSKREPADRVAVLFADDTTAPALEQTGAPPVDFATEDGELWLNGVLTPYQAQAAPLRPGRGR
ncbi:RES family NAD+ phosphorylase [Streptomyces sp. NPDC059718]